MAAVYGIIRNHDGWIAVDSGLGKGTTVRIYIPVVQHQSRKSGTSRPEELAGSGTILVIEDEESVMGIARQMLQRLGCRVLEATTGKEAINVIESSDGDINAVLLDIGLPDMEGSNVFSIITKVHPEIKVIVCSGYSIDGPVQNILDAGAHGFLQKPFSFNLLSEKLKEVLVDK